MIWGRKPFLLVGTAALVIVLASGRGDAADTKAACSSMFERTQELRLDGKKREARETAKQCSLPACPAAVKPHCTKWVTELEAELSSVTISVHDEKGQPIPDAKATLDGQDAETGAPVWLDPGQHKVVVRHKERTGERSFQTKSGEQGTPIVLVLAAPATASTATAPATTTAPPDDAKGPGPRTGAYVAAGVAVVGLAAFAYFGSSGKSERKDLADTCSPNCTDEQVASVRKKFLFADVGLVTGVVAGSLAAYWLLKPTESTAVAVGPRSVALRIGF